jgi:hypothetical protein
MLAIAVVDYVNELIIGALFSLLFWLAKIMYGDIKSNTKNVGRLFGKTDLMEQSANNKIDKLTETTEIKMQQMADGIDKLTESMEHFNGNYKSGNAGVAMVLEKVLDRLEKDARNDG